MKVVKNTTPNQEIFSMDISSILDAIFYERNLNRTHDMVRAHFGQPTYNNIQIHHNSSNYVRQMRGYRYRNESS